MDLEYEKVIDDNKTGLTDLHLHTTASDGTYPPEKVVRNAYEKGFKIISITDHDTTEGLDEALVAGNIYGIDVIPGIELTVEYKEVEMHILGYYINRDNDEFQNQLQILREIRVNRAMEMADKLENLGCKIPIDEILAESKNKAIGRLHIANSLIIKGYATTIDEAMAKYLRKGRPAYVPKKRLHPSEGIMMINCIGGIAVLAHPGIAGLEKFVPDLVEFGIEGIEAFHTKHSDSQTEKYIRIAEEHNLLITGGSDCHGLAKDTELLGNINLPYKYITALKEYHKLKR
ncbi:PHP domain-containing protein [Candidatus Gracilibacteria bacterium]|nr:PHP domain-containing protein [Candidatus Gracilibacteria bacterium]